MVMDRTEREVLFFEIHQGLPREGPGDYGSTEQAFSMLTGLQEEPLILDVGCGPGMQTRHLARLTKGRIIAVDNHQPFLDQLQRTALEEGVADRIRVVNADMRSLKEEFEPGLFDLIWAEGSAYLMGFEQALPAWKALLKANGYVAVTEISWLRPEVPQALKSFWEQEYPAIQEIDGNLAACRRSGYSVLGHFVLPESSWWKHYYNPLESRLGILEKKYQNDVRRLEYLAVEQAEIDLYRKYSNFYGYVFYVMQSD